jgi:YVTN family beta-propeller protein
MHQFVLTVAGAVVLAAGVTMAQRPAEARPYKIIKQVKVGGEGNFDFIYADVAARRLYIPRKGSPAVPATDGTTGTPAVQTRLSIIDLDTIQPIGEIEGVGGNGTVVDPKSGHGFTSSRPVSMFDARTMKPMKTIDIAPAQGDCIYFDPFNGRVYVFSHPTKDVTVIDARNGTVLGKIDLGGVPEQAVGDGKGMLYVVLQDAPGSVAAIDVNAMKVVAHYPLGEEGGCNGLAMDVKNHRLFAACATSGAKGDVRPQPMMVVLNATDGSILTSLPLAGVSDGAEFNPATMETYSTHGNGTLTVVKEINPTRFEVEQNLDTMPGAKTLTLDTKTNHILTMSVERGPAPPRAPDGREVRAPAIPGTFTTLVIGK